MANPRRGYAFFLILSVMGGFLTAVTYIYSTAVSVSPGDLAYRQPQAEIFADPFVLAIVVPAGIVAGLLVSPVTYFCLRDRRLSVAVPAVFVSTLATVALATPWLGLLGIVAGFAAVIGSCLVCAHLPVTARGVGAR
jgi:hypothetical protein